MRRRAPRRSLLPLALLALAPLVARPAIARAQQDGDEVQVRVVLPQPANGVTAQRTGANVVATKLLEDKQTRELLENGFATQLRYRLELWRKGGWFDDLESATEWAALVQYEPVSAQYRVLRRHGNQREDFGDFSTLAQAQAPLDRPYWVPLAPRSRGRRYYYTLTIEVQSLSVSDLDELQRWLRGELQPAVQGRSSVGGAIKSGLGTLVSRVLGGEKRHYERRSETFEAQ